MKKSRFLSLVLTLSVLAALFLPVSASALEEPALNCTHAVLLDANYNEVLYEKGAYEKAYPASITKVMTALLVLEAIQEGKFAPDTPITASASAAQIPEGSSTANIKAGEVLTVEQLLYCLLLPSANEAAQILAEAVDGDQAAFVEHMNQRAKELGCQGTHFVNVHGFHDPNHYTTAYDIALMMQAAMEHELFQTIITSPNYVIPATNLSEERTVRNTNALTSNWTYTGYLYRRGTGGKTGSTDEAGKCLVETAKDGDTYLISVILGSGPVTDANGEERQGQFYETIRLLDWGFDNFRRVTLAPEGTLVAKVNVNLSTQADEVNVKPQGEVTRTLPKDVDLDRVEMVPRLFSESVDAPVEAGQVLGTMVLSYEGTEYGTLDLVADTSVERSQLLYYKSQVEHFFQNSGVKLILAVVLIVGAVVLLRLLVFRRSRLPRRHGGGQTGPLQRTPPPLTPFRRRRCEQSGQSTKSRFFCIVGRRSSLSERGRCSYRLWLQSRDRAIKKRVQTAVLTVCTHFSSVCFTASPFAPSKGRKRQLLLRADHLDRPLFRV